MEELSFSYDGVCPILDRIQLQIPEGGEVALAGRSGSGKSTLAKLLVGLLEPQSGTIKIGGVPIAETDRNALHRRISIVMQEPAFFNLTIRENLLFAKPSAEEADFDTVCKKADIYEFIQSLPEGYDTVIGERGVKLSGGQRQRLAIARILLLDPQCIIFDEATSAVDHESEKKIVESLFNLSGEKTVILIAHRLATIARAQNVVLLENGRIVAEGSHSDLRGREPLYDKLFEKQNIGLENP